MRKDNRKKDMFESFSFPIVKNVSTKTIAEDLVPYTAEQTAKAMGEMFKKVEKETGYKISIEKGDSPIQALRPNKNERKQIKTRRKNRGSNFHS